MREPDVGADVVGSGFEGLREPSALRRPSRARRHVGRERDRLLRLDAREALGRRLVQRGERVASVVGGKRKLFALRPRLVVTDLELAARAAAAGLGIVRAPLAVVQPYVAKKRLVACLEKWTPPGLDVHAVFPPGGTLVPKTRAFVDMLQAWFERPHGEPTVRARAPRRR